MLPITGILLFMENGEVNLYSSSGPVNISGNISVDSGVILKSNEQIFFTGEGNISANLVYARFNFYGNLVCE